MRTESDGKSAWNLTPITRNANKHHLTDIETAVKGAVIDDGKALKYEVKAIYPRSTKLAPGTRDAPRAT